MEYALVFIALVQSSPRYIAIVETVVKDPWKSTALFLAAAVATKFYVDKSITKDPLVNFLLVAATAFMLLIWKSKGHRKQQQTTLLNPDSNGPQENKNKQFFEL